VYDEIPQPNNIRRPIINWAEDEVNVVVYLHFAPPVDSGNPDPLHDEVAIQIHAGAQI
jgi:hypothetical protein